MRVIGVVLDLWILCSKGDRRFLDDGMMSFGLFWFINIVPTRIMSPPSTSWTMECTANDGDAYEASKLTAIMDMMERAGEDDLPSTPSDTRAAD